MGREERPLRRLLSSREVTASQPPNWGERQPGGIFPANYNLAVFSLPTTTCAESANLDDPSRASLAFFTEL